MFLLTLILMGSVIARPFLELKYQPYHAYNEHFITYFLLNDLTSGAPPIYIKDILIYNE